MTEKAIARRSRGAFNGTKGKFLQLEIPGYHLHILNDTPGRISEALDNGYEFVSIDDVPDGARLLEFNADLGERIRYRVGVNEAGDALYAYHMKIREDWYKKIKIYYKVSCRRCRRLHLKRTQCNW